MENKYPVYCSWCWANEDKKTVIGHAKVKDSHGICAKCRVKYFLKPLKEQENESQRT